jgi:hypothetical protein
MAKIRPEVRSRCRRGIPWPIGCSQGTGASTDRIWAALGTRKPIRLHALGMPYPCEGESDGHMTEGEVHVVVVSSEPAAVVNLLGRKLTGYLPVAVPSIDKVAQGLRPGAIVLLDVGDVAASIAAAGKLRNDGFRGGIVLIGTTSVGGLTGVVGLKPPFRLAELVTALEKASRQHVHDVTVEPAQPPVPPAVGRGRDVAPIAETSERSEPPGTPQPPRPSAEEYTPLRRGQAESVPEVAKHAVVSADPSLLTGRQPTHPAAAASDSAGGAQVRSTLARWRQRLGGGDIADPATLTQRDMHQRLVIMLAATSQLEVLAQELPVLTDRMALRKGIVEAVVEEFEASSVGFWERDPDGWVVTVCYGFTEREARMPAGPDQPVLREIDANGGAILLEPVAQFQPLVRGIGGAHTESFMAAAVAVGDQHFGILALGRDHALFESDLDRLIEMASEAAVAIGVAEHLERMHALVEQSRSHTDSDGTHVPLQPGGSVAASGSSEQYTSSEASGVNTEEPDAGGAMNWSTFRPPGDIDPPDTPNVVIDLSDRIPDRR